MSKVRDKDLYLKLRFKRVLHLLGYYSPLEVELSHYQDQGYGTNKRASLTDLDVLGIKYDAVMTPHRVVGDCKSGRNVSDPNRLFWLRGVSDFFGAEIAYFLRPFISPHARAIAPKLGLRVLDESELSELEHNLQVDQLPLPIADPEFHEAKQDLWGLKTSKDMPLTKNDLLLKEAYAYLAYGFWYVDAHRNTFMLLDRFSRIAHLLQEDDPRHVLLSHVGLERFGQCILEMGGHIYARGLSELQKNARIYLYGGPLTLREREQMFKLIRQITGAQEELDPQYLPDILELANRMIVNPYAASKVLPYLEAIYGWCVQLAHSDLSRLYGKDLDVGAVVLARELCITFCRSTGVSERVFSRLLAM